MTYLLVNVPKKVAAYIVVEVFKAFFERIGTHPLPPPFRALRNSFNCPSIPSEI